MFGDRLRTSTYAVILVVSFFSVGALATPPDYKSLKRKQKIEYSPKEKDLLRIWVVYVGQGDGILIQLPSKYNYDSNPDDNNNAKTERLDVLVDVGSSTRDDAQRMEAFIENIYAETPITIEHVVLTHHDQDHVYGLSFILDNLNIAVENIYHNGLASFLPGKRGFPKCSKPSNAVYTWSSKSKSLTRGMAYLEIDEEKLKSEYLIENRAALSTAYEGEELQGVYERLAKDICEKQVPDLVQSFDRVFYGSPFVKEKEASSGRNVDLKEVSFELIWPLVDMIKYGGWSETINGNSVTFRFSYGDFQMLFTGDHNEKSEKAMLKHLENSNIEDLLSCDVLKVPHHGSDHALEKFFKHEKLEPVLSVASQGKQGARSKSAFGSSAMQHPSTDVIRWLGGAHRVYLTQMPEKRFVWSQLDTRDKHEEYYELSHVLIETDGEWFRIVEVTVDSNGLNEPPRVTDVSRSNGTRWIRAK